MITSRSLADRLHMQEQIRILFNWAPTPEATDLTAAWVAEPGSL